MFERLATIARHERYALCMLAIAIPAALGCYVAAALSAPLCEMVVYTYSGDRYVIAAADTCREVVEGPKGEWPEDWREMTLERR